MKDKAYKWWKQNHELVRRPVVFVIGLLFIMSAPLVGFIPGPGGIIAFLLGISILGSEFDWALALKAFFLKTVPKEVKKRWRPTPRWELIFDSTSIMLIFVSILFAYSDLWSPFISSFVGGISLFIFNRSRLDRFKLFLKRRKNAKKKRG